MQRFIIGLLLIAVCYACTGNELEIEIVREFAAYAEEEGIELYFGDEETGQLLYSLHGAEGDDNRIVTNTVCAPSGTFTIVMKDDYGDGWGNYLGKGSVAINSYGSQFYKGTLIRATGLNGSKQSYQFTVGFDILPFTQLKYTDVPQETSSWNTFSFDDSNWSSGVSGSLPDYPASVTTKTRYYRIKTNCIDRSAISSIVLNFKTKHGFVLYVQGTEIYRHKLPYNTPIVSTTASTYMDETIINKRATFNKYLLPSSGEYVVCFEIHLSEIVIDLNDLFLISGISSNTPLNSCSSTRFANGVYSSDVPAYSDYYSLDNLFNGSTDGYFRVESTHNVTITYTLPEGSAEWVNDYSIGTAIIVVTGMPKSWNLYASYDLENYSLVASAENYLFSAHQVIEHMSLRNNVQSYKSFKLQITDSEIPGGVAVATWDIHICNYDAPLTSFQYAQTEYVGAARIDVANIAPISSGYSQCTINPQLPVGLSISYGSCTILGSPTIAVDTIYTITAISTIDGSSSTTTMHMVFTTCEYPNSVQVSLSKKLSYYATEESFTFEDENNNTLYSSPSFATSGNFNKVLCLPQGSIRLILKDTGYSGWNTGSDLYIQYFDYIDSYYTAGKYFLKYPPRDTHILSTKFVLPPQSTQWTYTQGILPSNWYGTANPSSFNSYSMTETIPSTSTVWLFRHSFNYVPRTINPYSSFELRVRAHDGYIVYINGVELYRQNINGELTLQSVPTKTNENFSFKTITGLINKLHEGNNIVAIGLLNGASSSISNVYFECSIRLLQEMSFGRTWDITTSTQPTTSDAIRAYLFDQSYYNDFYMSLEPNVPSNLTINYGDNRAESINTFCIYSSYSNNFNDPSDWIVYGSNDGTTLTFLTSVMNAYFYDKNQKRCFYMPNNVNPWQYYIFSFIESETPSTVTTRVSFSELTLSISDVTSLIPPPLSFGTTDIAAYIGVPFTDLEPNSPLYGNYKIEPALPSSLELDTSTGSIRGVPTDRMDHVQYTITATNPQGTTSSAIIILTTQICTLPNIMFSIHVHTSFAASEISYLFMDQDEKVIYSQQGFANDVDSYHPFCLLPDVFILHLKDSGYDGWNGGYIAIELEDGAVLFKSGLGDNEYDKKYTVSIGSVITPIHTEWSYLDNNQDPLSGWNSIAFTSNWPKSAPKDFSSAVGTTQYFRRTFDLRNATEYAAISIDIKTRFGYIVYVNGEAIYNYNMPTNVIINSKTECLQEYDSHYTGNSVSTTFGSIISGTNVIAVEVHRLSNTTYTNIDFDASVTLIPDDSVRVLNGVATSNIAGNTSPNVLFDNIDGSAFSIDSQCEGIEIRYQYLNGRKEYISSYTLAAVNSCNGFNPSGWYLDGSNNNGTTWTRLHTTSNEILDGYSGYPTYNFYTPYGYNMFRLVTTECINTHYYDSYSCDTIGFHLGGISLMSKNLKPDCSTHDGYEGALLNQFVMKSCEPYYEGSIESQCSKNDTYILSKNTCALIKPGRILYPSPALNAYLNDVISYIPLVEAAEFSCNISSILPVGLYFNSTTAAITGVATTVFSAQVFDVTCSNTLGVTETRISISVAEKPSAPIWIWIVLAVIIVVVVVIVILCIVNRTKSKSKTHAKLESGKGKSHGNKPVEGNSTKTVKI